MDDQYWIHSITTVNVHSQNGRQSTKVGKIQQGLAYPLLRQHTSLSRLLHHHLAHHQQDFRRREEAYPRLIVVRNQWHTCFYACSFLKSTPICLTPSIAHVNAVMKLFGTIHQTTPLKSSGTSCTTHSSFKSIRSAREEWGKFDDLVSKCHRTAFTALLK